MKRAIIVVRESTIRQEIDSQINETVQFAESCGYAKDELIIIGEAGASAIQLNESYVKNMELIKETISKDSNIKCVLCWSLDRIGRHDDVLIQFKNFLVEHKVNLKIKEPSLTLLNEDGTLNHGTEIVFNILAAMSKQEMDLKKERFRRSKEKMASESKFIGARYMHYGYRTDDNGYLVIDKEEAKVVQKIFSMYLTKRYSCADIAIELNELGITNNKRKWLETSIISMLKDKTFIGVAEKNKLVKSFPRIISDEDFDAVKEIRDSRNKNIDKSQTIHLGVKVIKCIECGANYIVYKSREYYKYVCYNRIKGKKKTHEVTCTNSCPIPLLPMDEILKDLSAMLQSEYQSELTLTRIQEMREKKEELLKKVETLSIEEGTFDEKISKVLDAYTDDLISKSVYDKKVAKIKADKENVAARINSYSAELKQIDSLLEDVDKEKNDDEYLNKLIDIVESNDDEKDLETLRKRVMKYIKVVYLNQIYINKAGYALICAVDYNNNIYHYLFQQHHNNRECLFNYNINTNKITQYVHQASPNLPISPFLLDAMEDKDVMAKLNNDVKEFDNKVKSKL